MGAGRFDEVSIPALREMPANDLRRWLEMAQAREIASTPEAIQVAEFELRRHELGNYGVLVLACAGLPYPHPTEKDYQFIEKMWALGASYKATAKVLAMGEDLAQV